MTRSRYSFAAVAAALFLVVFTDSGARAGVGDVVGGFIRFSDGVSDDTYTVGVEAVDIGILDGDANASSTIRETIGPFTVTARGGDTVSVRLQEVLPDGGFFRIVQVDGSAATHFTLSDTVGKNYADRILFVGNDDTFTFTYTSAAGGDTLADTAAALVAPSTGVVTFVRGSIGSTTTPPFFETRENQNLASFADTIFVRLVDADANRNPLVRDTVLVAVRNLVTNDSEHLILFETTDTSGIFTCTSTVPRNDTLVASTSGGAGNNNGLLDAFFDGNTPTDTITVTYRDTLYNDFAQDTNFLAFPVSASGVFATAGGDTEADSGTIPGRAYPLVVDADQNANAAAIDTVLVVITSALTGDSERVTLTEIGVNFGVFFFDTGLRLSDTEGRNVAGDNTLFSARNDTITFTYTDPDNAFDTATDTLPVRRLSSDATVRILGDTFHFSVSPETRAVGETIAIGVIDEDRNDSPLASESIVVRLFVPRTGDYETVTLSERFAGVPGALSETSGTFLSRGFNIYISDTIGAVVNDSALFAAGGDTIELSYVDSGTTRIDSISVVRLPSTSSILFFLSATGGAVDSVTARGSITVRVSDPDQNRDVTVADSVLVFLRTYGTQDSVSVRLFETGVTSGVFVNSTDTIFTSDTYGLSGADTRILLVRVGDTIVALYSDSSVGFDTATASETVIAFDSRPSIVLLADTGFLVSPDSFAIGESIVAIVVTDHNRNANPLARDSFTVLLRVTATGDSASVNLLETTDTSGVFRSVDTVTLSDTRGVVAGDSILFAAQGDTVFFTYTDATLAVDSGTDSAVLSRNSAAGTVALFASAASLDTPFFLPDSTVFVRLVDPNPNVSVATLDSVTLVFRSARTGDTLSVAVTETSTATGGTFLGSFRLSDTAVPSAADTFLSVAAADSITVRYVDPIFGEVVEETKSVFASTSVAALSFARGAVAALSTLADTFQHGDSLFVRVFDRDRNTSPAVRDSVQVTIFSYTSAGAPYDSVTILLPEVRASDSAAVDTASGAFANPDTPIRISIHDSPVFSDTTLSIDPVSGRVDVQLSTTAPDTAFDTAVSISIPGTISLARGSVVSAQTDTFVHGDSLFVRVSDADRNAFDAVRDSVLVTVSSYDGNGIEYDSVIIRLHEVSATDTKTAATATGVFSNGDSAIRVTILDTPATGDTNLSIDPAAGTISVALSSSSPDTAVDTAATFSTAGTITFSRGTVAGAAGYFFSHGDSLFVRVSDADRNSFSFVRDSLVVTVVSFNTSGDTIDSVVIRLHEVSSTDTKTAASNSGVFSNGDTPIRLSISATPVAGDTTLSIGGDTSTIFVALSSAAPDTDFDTGIIQAAGVNASFALVDSSFVSADTFRVGDAVHVSVADSDLNFSPLVRDSFYLTLTSPSDSAQILLLETTETSGIFRTSTDSTFLSAETGTASQDVLFAGVGETIVATYFDSMGLLATLSDSARVAAPMTPPDTISIVDTTGLRVSRIRLGDTLGIEAFGPNLQNFTTAFDGASVLVRTARDSEYVTITETAVTGLVFRNFAGILVTAESHPHHGDGRIAAAVGDTIQVTLITVAATARDTVFVDSVAVTVATGFFRDTAGAQIDSKNIGFAFVPVLRDTGINVSPFVRDTFTLLLTTAALRDSVTVRFTESTESSSLFLGETVLMVQDGASYDPTDTALEVIGGDSVFLTLDGVTFGLNVLATSAIGAMTSDTFEIVLDGRFGPGDTLNAFVIDPDENEDPLLTESVVVTIRSLHDTVILRLIEAGTDSSLFRHPTGCTIALRTSAFPSTSDSILEVVDGETISVVYQDPDDAGDADTDLYFIRLLPSASSLVISSSAASSTAADSVLLGETLFVRVTDASANLDGAVRDTVFASVAMSGTGDTFTLLLRETGDSTSIFLHETGVFVDSALLPVASDSVLEAFYDDVFTATYVDARTATDSASASVRVRPDSAPSSSFTVVLSNTQNGSALSTFSIGDTLFVKITIPASAAAGLPLSSTVVDTFRLYFFSGVTHDSELVILTENDSSALVFTNNAKSGSTPGPLSTALTDGSVTLDDGLLELSAFGTGAFGAQAFAQGVVRAQSTHTSDSIGASSPDLPGLSFAGIVVAGAQITSAAGVVVYPNPYRPHGGNTQQGQPFSAGNFATGMLWGNMPATWRLRIFSIDGRMVADRSSQTENARGRIQGGTLYQFDVKNDFGDDMASGIYLYSLESPVGNRTGKFAVIR